MHVAFFHFGLCPATNLSAVMDRSRGAKGALGMPMDEVLVIATKTLKSHLAVSQRTFQGSFQFAFTEADCSMLPQQ